MQTKILKIVVLLVLFSLYGCDDGEFKTKSGISYNIMESGNGITAKAGDVVAFHYTGMFLDARKFDSSHDLNRPYTVIAGVGNIMPGLDDVLLEIDEGSVWIVTLPADKAYGSKGNAAVGIPPDTDLLYVIEMVGVLESAPKLESGVSYTVVETGTGESVKEGDTVLLHFSVWLPDKTRIQTTFTGNKPVALKLGEAEIIDGWAEVIPLMKLGSRWKVEVPSDLAYGHAGQGPIPPDTPLLFELEIVDIK